MCKQLVILLILLSNWSYYLYILILENYKRTHTTGRQVLLAAVCCVVNPQVISFVILLFQWISDCLIFSCISDWLLLVSFIQISFFFTLAFFNPVWWVLPSNFFNRCHFALRVQDLWRGISSPYKSSSISLASLENWFAFAICLSLFLLSRRNGDLGLSDRSRFIQGCHYFSSLVDSAMLQYAVTTRKHCSLPQLWYLPELLLLGLLN